MTGPLAHLTVLDLTASIAGNYCSGLLHRHGAHVTLVERPGGSPLRRRGPSGRPDADTSPLYRHLNAGKTVVEADLESDSDFAEVAERAASCDIVVAPRQVADRLDARGLPATVVLAVVEDFPGQSRRAEWLGGELVFQALSGAMYVTGSPTKKPLYGMGNRASYVAGTTAYASILAAVLERTSSGLGQRVSTSVLESVAATAQNAVTLVAYNGTYQTRREYPGMLALLECANGWAVMFALRYWPGLCETFGVPELVDDPRFATPIDRAKNWKEANAIFAEIARGMDVDWLVERGQERKVSIEKVHTMPDLLTSEHLALRGFFEAVDGGIRLGPLYRSSSLSAAPGSALRTGGTVLS